MREHTASRATWMLAYAPRMWTLASATTMRVRVAFSMANLVLPPMPAMRPIARERWSPRRVLTSVTSNDSTRRSSSRNRAMASRTSKPHMKADTNSSALVSAPESSVLFPFRISTQRVLGLKRTCRRMCSTSGRMMDSHCSRRGVKRLLGTRIWRVSASVVRTPAVLERGVKLGALELDAELEEPAEAPGGAEAAAAATSEGAAAACTSMAAMPSSPMSMSSSSCMSTG
mmetsp:Transcript_1523/g.6026  ORF Transcript_1523/g.6026 Transcript_1523/m.6026 type:complete len:229 (+) Transcript_1523:298-984(+)